jgi:hypothetical protein
MVRRPFWLAALAAPLALAAGLAGAGPSTHARVTLTVWPTVQPQAGAERRAAPGYGGVTYGGAMPRGVLVSEVRDVDVPASGELRIAGVAGALDPASVQLVAPGLAITEQRFTPAAASPTDVLARHVGETVTVVTAKGDITGVLRAADDTSLVLEVGTGDARRTEVVRREYATDVRLPAGGASERAELAWRVTSTKHGVQPVELAYRAAGMAWDAAYVAVLDEGAGTVALTARATIHNWTGAVFDDAEVTLVSGGTAQNARRYTLPAHVHLGGRDVVQVDLVAPRTVKAKEVVTYTPLSPDLPAAIVSQDAQQDCAQLSSSTGLIGRAQLELEVEVAGGVVLPEAPTRLYRRGGNAGDRLEPVSEDVLRASPGVARVPVTSIDTISGGRKQVACTLDEARHKLEERVEIEVANRAAKAQDVVVHELVWRLPMWRIDPATETVKGTRAGDGAQEYRVRVPANGSQKIAYTVVYTW